ncbi:MAG TPA: dienelactone hydrolase family protein [Myxococcales bacterium]|nr:dienelactone hydrolase family protein [Myxococcales bacterium]
MKTTIQTEDGSCPAYWFGPDGAPGVLVFMDGVGIRPAMLEVGERLGAAGFRALLPDLYYRAGPYAPMNAKTVFSDPKERDALRARFMSTTNLANVMRDTKAFLAHLPGKVAVTGYCMGGRFALAAAGTYPDRVVAAAAFHPGNPAGDAPDSPHLLAPKMKARVYVGGASDDASFPDVQMQRLEQALADARVDHLVERIPAKHGWVLTDTPAYDAAQAERHWQTLLDLLGRALKA